MGSARTLKRRRQRQAAKHRPKPRPLSVFERAIFAEGLRVLRRNLEFTRRVSSRYDDRLSVHGAKIAIPIKLGRLPER